LNSKVLIENKKGGSMLKDFKAFITRGSVIDMAVGIIIGAAFSPIISSFVNDVLMPPIGLALGRVDFKNLFVVIKEGTTPGPYASLDVAKAAGAVSINYGVFINTIITFLIIAAVVFFFIVRPVGQMRAREAAAAAAPAAPTAKECAYCHTQIPVKASRCPNCTSQL
jgi:large conductance mechanosensitive channel